LHKLIPIVLFVCAPAWAQSGLPSAQDSGSKPQAAESPQTAPDSDKKPAPDHIPPPPLADSTKLEPIQIKKAAYLYEAQEKKLQGEVVVRILVSETGDVETAEIVSAIPFWPSLRWMQSRNGSSNRSSRTANQWKFQRSYRSTSRFLKTSMMRRCPEIQKPP